MVFALFLKKLISQLPSMAKNGANSFPLYVDACLTKRASRRRVGAGREEGLDVMVRQAHPAASLACRRTRGMAGVKVKEGVY